MIVAPETNSLSSVTDYLSYTWGINSRLLILIGAITAGLIVISIAIGLFLRARNKKKGSYYRQDTAFWESHIIPSGNMSDMAPPDPVRFSNPGFALNTAGIANETMRAGQIFNNREQDGRGGQTQNESYTLGLHESSPDDSHDHTLTFSSGLTIGRSGQCGLVLSNPTVSGVQCILKVERNCLFVENRSSSNITKVNGSVCSGPVQVVPGDTLSLGSVELTILSFYKIS